MALAMMFEDESVLFIDAVTNYSKTRSSSVSNHPVDESSFVTDHLSKNNPVFTVRGVVSSADFHNEFTRPIELIQGGSEHPAVDADYNTPVNGASISTSSSITDLLPGSIQQIIGSVDGTVSTDSFRGYNHQTARDRIEQAWEDSELITILDYDYDIITGRSEAVRLHENCLIRRYADNEDVETGDTLTFNITFNKVRFATLEEVEIEVDPPADGEGDGEGEDVGDSGSGESNEGDQSPEGTTNPRLADYLEKEGKETIDQLLDFTKDLKGIF